MDLTNSMQKKSIEYLFYGVNPALPNEIYRAMEEGFRNGNEYQNMGLDAHVSLVNSIYSAESARINAYLKGDGVTDLSLSKSFSTNSLDNLRKIAHLPSGHILVCKVFYPGTKYINVEQHKETSKKKTWHVQDPGLILPEYLVEFEYSTEEKKKFDNTVTFETKNLKNKEVNKIFSATIEAQKILQNTYLNPQVKEGVKNTGFHISAEDLDRCDMGSMKNVFLKYLKNCHVVELIDNNFKFPDEEVTSSKAAIENSLPPEIPTRPKIDSIKTSTVKSCARETNLEYIKYLNLFNNNIEVMENLNGLVNLVTLVLSFNEIKVIQGLEEWVNLKRLDLNHNFISKITGLDKWKDLNVLNLSNNWISEKEDIEYLADNEIPLNEFSLKCNPIAANPSYRSFVFQNIPYLKKLDGIVVSEKDSVNESETVMTKELLFSSTSSQAVSNTPAKAGFSALQSQSKPVLGEIEESDEVNFTPEILVINHNKIKTIKNLHLLPNLRRLSLADNLIAKIQGLESCKLLEELSLEK